jgi:uncharacterized protein YndB with AHSA1/START domain
MSNDEGILERTDGRVVLRYERTLAHPVDVVWRALTDAGEHERWSGWRTEIDLVEGGELVTTHQTGDRVVDRITRVDPPHVFQHTFWFDQAPQSLVTWTLHPDGDGGCRLVLTHEFADGEVPDEASNAAGWHGLLDLLAASLDGHHERPGPAMWESLTERYRARLGASAD